MTREVQKMSLQRTAATRAILRDRFLRWDRRFFTRRFFTRRFLRVFFLRAFFLRAFFLRAFFALLAFRAFLAFLPAWEPEDAAEGSAPSSPVGASSSRASSQGREARILESRITM